MIERLLDGGAVGWFVPQPEWSGPLRSARCRNEDDGSVKIQQICAHLPERWSLDQSAGDAIPHPPPRSEVADPKRKGPRQFLAHCTRGNSGPLPEEGEHVYQDRVWIEGRVRECHPLVTLNRICQQRRLRGTSRITRTTQRSVSFSAVPLPRLLRSRNFQSHLQRWDWEPYGLLIDRDALEGLGARPVIYGDEIDYARLPAAQKPYFQPLGKEPQQWAQEREWRLLGDLDLSVLPGDAVRLFVRTRIEALHMARIFSWPVLWIQ